MATIEHQIASLIAVTLRVDHERVTRDASFVEDLGADSLDCVALILAIEEQFSVDIHDEEAEQLHTVRQMIEYVMFAAAANEALRASRPARRALRPDLR